MGVWQGCSLSGMFYSLAIEPLLNKFRRELSVVCFPRCASAFKLSAYTDDVVFILNKQNDIHILEENVGIFKKISSATINWKKSEAVLIGRKTLNTLTLPGGLTRIKRA